MISFDLRECEAVPRSGGRDVGLVGIAGCEMAERGHHVIIVVTADGAEDITGLSARNLGAFHQREVTGLGSIEQGLEIGAGLVRDGHRMAPL